MSFLNNIIVRVDQLPGTDDGFEVEWVGASSLEAIREVERILSVRIQGSYRDFVLAVGGGGLRELSVSAIPRDRPEVGACSDTLEYRQFQHRPMPHHLVVIQRDADNNEPFCLDTSQIIDGENPVVLFYHQSGGRIEPIAESFMAFYKWYLQPYFDQVGV